MSNSNKSMNNFFNVSIVVVAKLGMIKSTDNTK